MLSLPIKRRIVVKFHVKLEKTDTETYIIFKEVDGNEYLLRVRVFEWYKRFRDNREDDEDQLPFHIKNG